MARLAVLALLALVFGCNTFYPWVDREPLAPRKTASSSSAGGGPVRSSIPDLYHAAGGYDWLSTSYYNDWGPVTHSSIPPYDWGPATHSSFPNLYYASGGCDWLSTSHCKDLPGKCKD
jgi:hypothetical protein